MAYDFQNDPNCIALYNFESGALTTDSKGSNTLTASASPPTADTTNFRQGAASALYALANTQYHFITDANLPSDWPFKSGDTTKLMSFSLAWRPASYANEYRTIVAKWKGSYRTFKLCQYGQSLYLRLAYANSSGATWKIANMTLVNDQWYHVAVAINGVTGEVYAVTYGVTEDVTEVYHNSLADDVNISDQSNFTVGADSDLIAGIYADGRVDQLAIFKDLLSQAEMAEITGGELPAAPSGTRFYFPGNQVAAVAPAYDATWEHVRDYPASPNTRRMPQAMTPTKVLTSNYEYSAYHYQAGFMSAIEDILVQQFVSEPLAAQTISGTVKGQFCAYQSTTDTHGDYFTRAILIKVVSGDGQTVRGTLLSHFPEALVSNFPYYQEAGGPQSPQNRSIPPSGTNLTPVQAQDGDRIVIEVGGRWIGPAGTETYGESFLYIGCKDEFGDLPEEETIVDWDSYAPWVEFSQELDWYVPTKAVVGDGGVGVSGTMAAVGTGFEDPPEEAIVGSGYVKVGGGDTYVMERPRVLTIDSVLGLRVAGTGTVAVVYPSAVALSSVVAVTIAGVGTVFMQRPKAVVASGWVNVGGRGVVTCTRPTPANIVATGGVKVGSTDLPLVTCTRPEIATLAVVSSGIIEIGGGNRESVFYPEITDVVPAPLRIRIGGDGGAAVYYPPVMAIVSVGGVFVAGGSVEEQAYETWVLTGVEHQPSIYSGFQFNSYAEFRGQHFACGDDGIYLMNLEQSGDDDGEEVHPGLRIGPANFGAATKKFIRSIHIPGSGTRTRVMVSTPNKGDGYPVPHKPGVFVGQRELVDDEFTIDITDFEKVGHIEIVPMILPRR